MDDDPVLRALGADLERDDPRLAALLTGMDDEPRGGLWLLSLLLLGPPLLMGLFLVEEVAFGVAVLLLALAAPLVVGWLLLPPSGTPRPGAR